MTKDDCKQQIAKIAENNVEVQWYLISPVDGSKVVCFTESYGQTRIDEDKVAAETEQAEWDELRDVKVLGDRIAVADAAVAFYDKLQTAMTSADGTILAI